VASVPAPGARRLCVSATRLLEQQSDIPRQNPLAISPKRAMMAVEIMIARQLTSCAALVCY
jgi:hypothetical protein